jgi:hypothetical protein
MGTDDVWTMRIGDFVKSDSAGHQHRGRIVDITYPYICPYADTLEPGEITTEDESGNVHIDYYHAFEEDKEMM